MDAARPPLLTVAMPVFDEVATIDAILERVLGSPVPKEVVVVDDGSTDGTRARLGTALLTAPSNLATDLNLTDMETCYKAVRRDLLQSIPLAEERFGFEPELTAKLARAGARVFEVPISYQGRTYAEGKKIGWRD